MDSYIMSRIDDHEIDCYHQYIAQTNYRCEQPENDGHMMMLEPHGRVERPHDTYYPVGVSPYANGPRSFGEVAQRPPDARQLRQPLRRGRNIDLRNGLHLTQATQAPRADCGDYYNSLPGLGSYERPSLLPQHPMRNRCPF